MASIDVEKGFGLEQSGSSKEPERDATASTGEGKEHGVDGSTSTTNATTATNKKDSLHVFQTLVGIRFLAKGGAPLGKDEQQEKPANVLQDIFRPSKASENRFRNRGLYDRALSQELKNRVLYAIMHYIIFSLYILQILLAATITAISAYHNTSSPALTVLGALNTVIAGLLAWLTGQGMPSRFRRARDQYREVVKCIEAAERLFAEEEYIGVWPDNERPDPVRERNKLEDMFEQARIDQEANYPDVHYSPPNQLEEEKKKKVEAELEKWKQLGNRKAGEAQLLQKELADLKASMTGGLSHMKEIAHVE